MQVILSYLNAESVSVFDESNVPLESRRQRRKKVCFAFLQSAKVNMISIFVYCHNIKLGFILKHSI